MNKLFSRLNTYVAATLFLIFAAFVRYSFSIGAYYCNFSAISCAPLLGAFFNLGSLGAVMSLYTIAISILKGGFIPFSKTLALPTLLSSLCFSSSLKKRNEVLLFVALPLTLFILFVLHPQGQAAWYYGLYWVVPIAVYAAKQIYSYTSLFTTALASTFIAHAVGSVIYLYSFNIPAQQWSALIPVVAVERLLIASSMTLLLYAFSFCLSFVSFFKKSLKNNEKTVPYKNS